MKKLILAIVVMMTMSSSVVQADMFDRMKDVLKQEAIDYVERKIDDYFNDNETSQQSPAVTEKLVYTDFSVSSVTYSNLDHLNRAGQATAYLTKENVTKTTNERGDQSWLPTGYVKNAKIWDNGHLIAYSLTYNLNADGQYEQGHDGSLDNPKNLVAQTRQVNRGDIKQIENKVRKVLKRNEKVIYRVTPIFEEDNLVASRFHVEAVSEFGTLSIDEMIENVQDGKTIDYATGRVK